MVFTFLTSIVFVAELIIAFTIFKYLINLDKNIIKSEETLELAKPKLEAITELITKISKQFLELSEDFVNRFKKSQEDLYIAYLSKFLLSLLLLKINSKAINNFRRSKTTKFLSKGLSMLENMV